MSHTPLEVTFRLLKRRIMLSHNYFPPTGFWCVTLVKLANVDLHYKFRNMFSRHRHTDELHTLSRWRGERGCESSCRTRIERTKQSFASGRIACEYSHLLFAPATTCETRRQTSRFVGSSGSEWEAAVFAGYWKEALYQFHALCLSCAWFWYVVLKCLYSFHSVSIRQSDLSHFVPS